MGMNIFYIIIQNLKLRPKQNYRTEPYILLLHILGSTVKTWLGSDNENSAYYGGELLSGSDFDNSNQNNLHYAVPEFIREDSDNNPYELFINMMGTTFSITYGYIQSK